MKDAPYICPLLHTQPSAAALLQVGYRADNGSEFRQLVWHPSRDPGAKPSDGTWGCPNAAQPYPAMQHSLVHPCTATAQICCGLGRASFNLRFRSFFAAPKAMLLMAYDVIPSALPPLISINNESSTQGRTPA